MPELPTELLALIFTMGCEDEDFVVWHAFQGRRLKAFAAKAKLICSRWRQMIESPFYSHFWIARLGLRLPQASDTASFLPEWINFRQLLNDSQSCNIAVLFDWRSSFSWIVYQYQYDNPNMISIMFRLFVHGMNLIHPRRKQIVSIRLRCHEPWIAKQFLELLMQLEGPTSLVEIELTEPFTGGLSLPELWNGTQFRLHDVIVGLPTKVRMPLPLVNLRHLERIRLPSVAWLDSLSMTPTLRQISIHDDNVPRLDSFLHHLADGYGLFTGLVVLSIEAWSQSRTRDSSTSTSTTTLPNPYHLVFPKLRVLNLGTYELWAQSFLAYSACPMVEKMCLSVRPEKGPYALESSIKTQPFPRLITLELTSPFNHMTVHLLKHLAKSPIGTLSLIGEADLYERFSPIDSQVGWEISQVVSTMQLQTIRIEGFALVHPELRRLLSNLPYNNVRSIKVSEQDMFFHANGNDVGQYIPAAAPLLTEVSIQGYSNVVTIAWFLTLLKADSLEYLSIQLGGTTIEGQNVDWISWDDMPSMPSVREVRHEILSADIVHLRHFWRMFPNIQTLELTIHRGIILPRDGMLPPNSDILKDVRSIFDVLKPVQNIIPAPRLTRFVLAVTWINEGEADSIGSSMEKLFALRASKGRAPMTVQKSWDDEVEIWRFVMDSK